MSTHTPKPPWIKSVWPCNPEVAAIKKLLRQNKLSTVCQEAQCPNLGECFTSKTAAFMIMGNVCTRHCRFCNVTSSCTPQPLDPLEPINLADTVSKMGLKYVVITSVTRDDLSDGGATHFVNCIQEVRKLDPLVKIEILVPDFRQNIDHALVALGMAPADVFNHNLETVPRLYAKVRPQAHYQTSLNLLKKHKELYPQTPTKSGLMLGLGETIEEIENTLYDLRKHQVDRLTLGQYLQPTKKHLDVIRYVAPLEFSNLAKFAYKIGFKYVTSAPLARSSYHAKLHNA